LNWVVIFCFRAYITALQCGTFSFTIIVKAYISHHSSLNKSFPHCLFRVLYTIKLLQRSACAISDLVCGCRLTKCGGRYLMGEWSSRFYNGGARISTAKEVSGGDCCMASIQA